MGMTTQIAVRLPDVVVELVDEMVSTGRASSRAEVVSRALLRELRRERQLRDIAILRATADGADEFVAQAQHASRMVLDLD